MAISVDWATKVITVPKADTTLFAIGPPEVRRFDVDAFRLTLKALEAGEAGMSFLDTHRHNTEVILGGITYARTFEIINGYSVTFEAGAYRVDLFNANHNILDVANYNSVQLTSANSAGLTRPDAEAVWGAAYATNAAAGTFGEAVVLAAGNSGLHFILDGGAGFEKVQVNANNNMATSRRRIFASAADRAAATLGAADDADGEIARVVYTGNYETAAATSVREVLTDFGGGRT